MNTLTKFPLDPMDRYSFENTGIHLIGGGLASVVSRTAAAAVSAAN